MQGTATARANRSALTFPRLPHLRKVRPASLAKLAGFLVMAGAVAAIANFVLPSLEATGIWAYAVGFFIYVITSATVIVPVPGMAFLVVMAQELNIVALAIAAGIGGALGELVGYWLGAQGRGPLRGTRVYARVGRAMERFGGAVVFLFALVPVLPMDGAGLIAGATRYPVVKFLVYSAAGKGLLLLAVFAASSKAFEWAAPFVGWAG